MNLTKENIMEHVDIDPVTGCWNWKLSKDRDGYGYICPRRSRKTKKAHRVAHELFIGSIPKDLFVCHHCDNPPCCNPAHLFLGTNKDNMRDAMRKDRLATGEKNGNALLTDEKVRSICLAYVTNHSTIAYLAKQFGVGCSTIRDILKGRTWTRIATKIISKCPSCK